VTQLREISAQFFCRLYAAALTRYDIAMSVFTTVTAEQLEAWLKNYDLGTLVELKGIAAGIENTNYFVTTTHGRYVLTLFEKLTAHELPYYLNLMAHLAQHGIPCPAPLADRAGRYLGELNGKPASLVTRLAGKDLANPTPADCAKVGAVLARIHIAGQSYTGQMHNPRGSAWWAAATPKLLPFLNHKDAAMLQAAALQPDAPGVAQLPRGAIHADLFRDNVLFDNGEVAGVIDFYFACSGALLYDVAITVNDWCNQADSRLDPARTSALLAGYHAVRSFTHEERGAWVAMLRAGALRFWVSRLHDFYLPRPGELTHAKDPGHFQRLLQSHIAHERELPPLPH
jgi:homoserine kinase type II